MDPMLHYYNELERHVLSYNPALDKALLYKAYCYAAKAHEGQTRKDGSPYITHPLAVANIVADLKLDTDSLCAALLHDCIEDTKSHPRGHQPRILPYHWPIWWKGSPS